MSVHNVHGTAVFYHDKGVLLMGDANAGKSELALQLMDHGAELIADDQVLLQNRDGVLYASAPKETAGLLELRGVGLLQFDFKNNQRIDMIIAHGMIADTVHQEMLFGVALPCGTVDFKSPEARLAVVDLLKRSSD